MSKQRKPFISMLEPRILFDGAALTTAVDTLDATSFDNNEDSNTQEAPATQSPGENRKEVVFIDAAVKDKETLIEGIKDGIDVYILDDESDALTQIADILKTYDDIDGLHIISHGGVGSLNFATGVVDETNLDTFQDSLDLIASSLSEDGDILLYGCNVASNGEGQSFIDEFANITSADVAASDDVTGLGGDWDLEKTAGLIETITIDANDYDHNLGSIQKLGDAVSVDGESTDTATFPTLAELSNNNVIVVWWNSTQNNIEGQLYSLNGTAIGSKIVLVDTGVTQTDQGRTISGLNSGNSTLLTISALTNGGFVLGYSAGDGVQIDPYVQVFNNDGTARTDAIRVGSAIYNEIDVEVAALRDGGFTVSFFQQDNNAGNANWGIVGGGRYDDNGNKILNVSAIDIGSHKPYYDLNVVSIDGHYGYGYAMSYITLNGASYVTFYEGSRETSNDSAPNRFYVSPNGNRPINIAQIDTNKIVAVYNYVSDSSSYPSQYELRMNVLDSNDWNFNDAFSFGSFSRGFYYQYLDVSVNSDKVIGMVGRMTDGQGTRYDKLYFYQYNDSNGSFTFDSYFNTIFSGSNYKDYYEIAAMSNGSFWVVGQVSGLDNNGDTNGIYLERYGANTPPSISVGNATFTEQTPLSIDASSTISDGDGDNISGMTISLDAATDTDEKIVLANRNSGDVVNGITITYTTDSLITLSGSTTASNYQELLRELQYQNNSDEPVASRTITVSANDAQGGSGSDTATITLNDVNDAPIATAGATLNYTENDIATVIDNTITLSDVDDTQIAGATISISNNFVSGDTLGFTNQNEITGSYNSSTGVLTLSGTTSIANYQTALRSIAYSSSSDNPTNATRTISWQVTDANSDGAGAQSSSAVTSTVNVTPVNDAPTISSNGGGATASVNVDENLTAVTTVTATDAEGETLTFSKVGGTDADKFSIDISTGELVFNTAPDYENALDSDGNNDYEVIIQVSDGTNNVTQTITVNVQNVGFGFSNPSSFSAAENQTSVGTATTNEQGGGVTYSIKAVDDHALFSIDSSTGEITFLAAPDFENALDIGTNNIYNITLIANDGGGDVEQAITVNVTNINEAPVFTSTVNASVTNATENTPYSYTLTANDVDANSQLVFDGTTLPDWLSIEKNNPTFDQVATADSETYDMVSDDSGNIYYASYSANKIWKIDSSGNKTLFAGTGTAGTTADGTDALSADIRRPASLAYHDGALYVSESNGYFLKIDIATNKVYNIAQSRNYYGSPMAFDDDGNFYTGGWNTYIFKYSDNDNDGVFEYSERTILQSYYQVMNSVDQLVYHDGKLYMSSTSTGSIYSINIDGKELTKVAGGNGRGTSGIDGLAVNAQLSQPTDIEFDSAGNLYIADRGDNRIKYIDSEGYLREVDGAGYVRSTRALTLDSDGKLYASGLMSSSPYFEIKALSSGGYELKGTPTVSGVYDVELRVTDGGLSDTQTFQITVADVNDAPVLGNSNFVISEHDVVGTNVGTITATDEDGVSPSLDLIGSPEVITYAITGGNTNNAFAIDENTGEITIAKALNAYLVSNYRLTVTASDDSNAVTTAVVTISVTDEADTPIASADTASTNEDNSVTIDVLANDTDADNNINTQSVTIVTEPSNGTAIVNSNGEIVYTPNAHYHGNDTISYKIYDSTGLVSNTVSVDITVNSINDVPVTYNGTVSTDEDTTLEFDLSQFVLDNDGLLDISSFNIVSSTTDGVLTPDGVEKGKFTYTPNNNFYGIDSFTFKVTDSQGAESNTSTVNINVASINDIPVANADFGTTNEDTAITIDLTANDSDDSAIDDSTLVIVKAPENGIITNHNNGTVTYTPNLNFNGIDEFLYTVRDDGDPDGKELITKTTLVTVSVTAINDTPVTVADSYTLDEDSVLKFNPLVNDSDVETTLTLDNLIITSQPTNGSLIKGDDGLLEYIPNANYNGNDSFNYKLNDGYADSNEVTVSLTINSVNDVPRVTVDDSSGYTELVNASTQSLIETGAVSFNDIDTGDVIDVTFVSDNNITWSGGTLDNKLATQLVSGFSLSATNQGSPGSVNWSYSVNNIDLDFLAQNETIAFSYTVTVTDNNNGTDTDVVNFTITGTNDQPLIDSITTTGALTEVAGTASGTTQTSASGTMQLSDLDGTNTITLSEVYNNDMVWSGGTITDNQLNASQIQSLIDGFVLDDIGALAIDDATNTVNSSWTYTTSDNLNFLAEGETLTFSYTITATDDSGAELNENSATKTVTITITGTNDQIVDLANDISEYKLNFGSDFTKDISTEFSDIDLNDTIVFQITGLPKGLSFNSTTGVISGKLNDVGTFDITIKANDGTTTTNKVFKLEILGVPSINEPTNEPASEDSTEPTQELDLLNLNEGTSSNEFSDNFDTDNFENSIDESLSNVEGVNELSGVDNNTELTEIFDSVNNNNQTNNYQMNTIQAGDNNNNLLEASLDVNVGKNGQVQFSEEKIDSEYVTGITIEDFSINENIINIEIFDSLDFQNYSATLIDGSILPEGIIIDSNTGTISGELPEGVEELTIRIKAESVDGTTRILNIKIDLKVKEQNTSMNDSFIPFSEQIKISSNESSSYVEMLKTSFNA